MSKINLHSYLQKLPKETRDIVEVIIQHNSATYSDHMGEHKEIKDSIKAIREDNRLLREEIMPIMELFKHMSWLKKTSLWLLGVMALVLGVVISIKKIL